MLRDINLVFLQYYQDTIYIHNYGYISMCLWCFCCILHYCNFKFSIRKPSIALYGILFQKSHKKLHGTIFSIHLSNIFPHNYFDKLSLSNINWASPLLYDSLNWITPFCWSVFGKIDCLWFSLAICNMNWTH